MRVGLLWNEPSKAGGPTLRPIEGTVEPRIDPKALARATTWKRCLKQHGEGDAAWNWTRLLKDFSLIQTEGLGRYLPFSLWALGDLQGLMIVEVSGLRHRTRSSKQPQAYIEYLSVAPHNREHIRHPRLLIGCGSRLLNAARNESVRRGWEGRLGLHSLSGAMDFYMSQGFRDLGSDPQEDGFHYLEHSGKL